MLVPSLGQGFGFRAPPPCSDASSQNAVVQ